MKVSIRPLVEKDAYTSVKWRNIPDIWQFTKFKTDKEVSIEDELSWIRKVIKDPTCKRFAIVAGDTYVGNVYLTNIHDKTAEYHIFIGDVKYWGKGIASDATQLILAFAKDKLHLKSVTLEVKEENQAAMKTYKKYGFMQYGKNGEFISMRLAL